MHKAWQYANCHGNWRVFNLKHLENGLHVIHWCALDKLNISKHAFVTFLLSTRPCLIMKFPSTKR